MQPSSSFGKPSLSGLALAALLSFAGAAQAQQAGAPPAVAAPTSAQIQELLDKQAITELINTYPRGLDRLDRELLLSIGHPDAKMTFGKTEFPSWAAYVDWLMKAHDEMTGNNHRMTNILIRVNGDHAVSETTGTATLLVPKAGDPDMYEERWMHSRYLDTWSRRNGKWGLDGRKTVSDYRRISYVSAAEVKKNYQIAPRAGRNDPSYKLFGAQ